MWKPGCCRWAGSRSRNSPTIRATRSAACCTSMLAGADEERRMDPMSNCSGCSDGRVETPAKYNAAGKAAIDYRIGTHQVFKTALLTRLSTSDFPALKPLTTRGGDDFTIAVCDTFAALAD